MSGMSGGPPHYYPQHNQSGPPPPLAPQQHHQSTTLQQSQQHHHQPQPQQQSQSQSHQSGQSSNQLRATWHGHVASTMDALKLFEACLDGKLNHVPRRPHDREREELIRSGNVFIYEEHSSGIKRWTDGYNWSPSRILGNFLIYRELEKAFPPGEKKKAKKNPKNGVKKSEGTPPAANGVSAAALAGVTAAGLAGVNGAGVTAAEQQRNDSQRALIGSLVDSYPFKDRGLVKKTISVHWNGIPHHLVSYYNVEDVEKQRLTTPSRDEELRSVVPRTGLISSQNFRVPVEQDDLYVVPDDQGRWSSQPNFYGTLPGLDPNFMMYNHPRSASMPSFMPMTSPYRMTSPYTDSSYAFSNMHHHMPMTTQGSLTSSLTGPLTNSLAAPGSLTSMHNQLPLPALPSNTYAPPQPSLYASFDPTRPPQIPRRATMQPLSSFTESPAGFEPEDHKIDPHDDALGEDDSSSGAWPYGN